MGKQDKIASYIDPRLLIISFFPILTFIFLELFLSYIIDIDSRIVSITDISNKIDIEFSYRLQMNSLFIVYIFSALFVFTYFILDIFLNFSQRTIFYIIISYTISSASITLVIAIAYYNDKFDIIPRTKEVLGENLFISSLSAIDLYFPNGRWGRESFDRIINATNVITILAVPAFVAGGVSCTARLAQPGVESWRWQAKRLRTYVLLSAWTLTVGVIYLRAWTIYPSFALEPNQAKLYAQRVDSYIAYAGIEYVLIIAAYAFPVYYVLKYRSISICRRIHLEKTGQLISAHNLHANATLQSIAEKEKLSFAPAEIGTTLVAMLAPLLAGGLPTLAKLF